MKKNNNSINSAFSNGDKENYEMTYEKFQQLVEKCDDKLSFIVDDKLNTAYADEIK